MKEKEGENSAKTALYTIRFLCGFALPFLVILCCYILAGVGIRRTRLRGKSRPLRILAGLVCAFFVCWAPYHVFLLIKMTNSKSKVVKVGHTLAKGVAYFNSCVNPVLYFCMGLNLRRRLGQTLSGVYRRALAEDGDGPTTQSQDNGVEESSGSLPGQAAARRKSSPAVGPPRA